MSAGTIILQVLLNIVDVQSCSVLYQRYFKDNEEQQKFLNRLHHELKQVQP